MKTISSDGGVTKVKTMRKRLCSECGGAMVETAISASILLTVVLGLMQGFLALYGYHYVSYAAREASRWAMVRGSSCHLNSATMTDCGASQDNIQTYVQGLGFPGIDSSKVTVTASWAVPTATTPTSWTSCAPCNDPQDMVTVKVNYAFPFNIPFLSNTTVNMSSTSSMVISQ
ncbi:MAG TPA: TadE/TadG family type IV pilus assembly protein [Silvibacterium sp.]|nr:TadE/TadG family type IV pilus assembly protein [Silvibacterium sp.]